MKKISKLLILAVLLLIFVQSAMAVPAYPRPLQVKQSNGKTLTYRLYGDEYVSWAKTIDGYTLMQKTNGDFVYATYDKEGRMVASDMLASNEGERTQKEQQFLNTIGKDVFYSPMQLSVSKLKRDAVNSQLKKKSASAREKSFTTSDPHFLVLLVSYSDVNWNSSNVDLFYHQIQDSNYTANGATGSVRDYFADNAFGAINPHFDVFGPIVLPKTRSYYAANEYEKAYEMAWHAAKYLDTTGEGVDFSKYDNDGDGVIDMVHVVYAGQGANTAGSNSGYVWPHMYYFPTWYGQNFSLDGKSFNIYACSSEHNGYMGVDHIGAVCHEMGHAFGLPDLYDTDFSGSGQEAEHPGEWDVMASGSYNNNSKTPPYYSSVERDMLGWGNIHPLTDGNITLYPIADSNTAYKIHLNQDEYLVFEYRNHDKWDAYLPGVGMLVWHADTSQINNWDLTNSLNADPNDRGLYIEKTVPNANLESGRTPYPGTSNVTNINYFSLTNGTQVDGFISNIHYEADSSIVFNYASSQPVVFTLSADSITTTSAVVSGSFSAQGTISDRKLQYKKASSNTYTTIDLNADTFTNTLDNLHINTEYKYRLMATLNGTVYYSVEKSFQTLCSDGAIMDFPWNESFENGLGCWTQSSSTGAEWVQATSAIGGYVNPKNGSYLANLNFGSSYYSQSSARLVSPVFDFTNVNEPFLTFYHSAYSAVDTPLKLYYRTSPQDSWVLLASYENTSSSYSVSWKKDTVTIPERTATMQISFVGADTYYYGVAIDYLNIKDKSPNSEIEEIEENFSMAIVPNPTADNAVLLVENLKEQAMVYLTDAVGRVISVKSLPEGSTSCELDSRKLGSGLYYVRVVTNTKSYTQKLIRQ